jgi:hypothetical protein
MMKALIAGGMDAAWSEERDVFAEQHADADYHPNKGGLREVPLREYGDCDFPLKYQDKLIKVIIWGLDGLAVNPTGYRVLIMLRDAEERRQSFIGAFNRELRHPWCAEPEQRIEREIKMLRNRNDVLSVDVMHYRDLVFNPDRELALLDWPINVQVAAQQIDRAQYRFQIEKLTVGI